MSHHSVTPASIPAVPGNTHLLVRKGRYYVNLKVPKDLRVLLGREMIRESLGTSDFGEAKLRRNFQVWRITQEWEELRKKLKKSAVAELRSALSDREAHELVSRFFIEAERQVEQLREQNLHLSGAAREEAMVNLGEQLAVLQGGTAHLPGDDGSSDAAAFLKREGISLPRSSESFKRLAGQFRRANLTSVARTLAGLTGQMPIEPDPLFLSLGAHTHQSGRCVCTLGELLRKFMESRAKRSAVTLRTYETPCRLLREFFREETALDEITRERMGELFALLARAPTNATKRYPKMTLAQAIDAADRAEDGDRLGAKSLDNYFTNISAIFNFAREMRLMTETPITRTFRGLLLSEAEEPAGKVQFEIEDLNGLFKSSEYLANRRPRPGRFFVPLLALFHGFRLNEACQLFTEDVKEEGDILFVVIRREREDGSKCEKRLKTKQSKRTVPVHPDLLSLGFHDFVRGRRADSESPRLFPDLTLGRTGYFSDPFGKWFAAFVDSVLGEGCAATFHSFRHMFRDALRNAEVSTEDAVRLGGWKSESQSEEANYGRGPNLQRLHHAICKVTYPGLDLAPLHQCTGVQSEEKQCGTKTAAPRKRRGRRA